MKIVVLDSAAISTDRAFWRFLDAYGDTAVYDRTPADQIAARIGGAEFVLVNKAPITAETIAACPDLRYIGVLATGFNIVDAAAAAARGIPVCNVPGYSTDSVAQFVFALLLEHACKTGLHSARVAAGDWQTCPDFSFTAAPLTDLTGKTIGVVGFGAIGQRVAAIARAFGMDVLVHTRTRRPELLRPGMAFCALDELLRQSDVITLHCPLTPDTQGLVGTAAIGQMKPGAVLINTARGGLIDDGAVAGALGRGELSAFLGDVLTAEPPREGNPLIGAKNSFITPHIAWATPRSVARLTAAVEGNIKAFLAGAPQNRVN